MSNRFDSLFRSSSNPHKVARKPVQEEPQTLHDSIHQLPNHKLLELVEQMMEQMGLDEGKKEGIRRLGKDQLVMMVTSHMNKKLESMESVREVRGSPESYISFLKKQIENIPNSSGSSSSGNRLKQYISLRINLSSQPLSWLQPFLRLSGHVLLLTLLKHEQNTQTAYEILKCLKSLMNHKYGLKSIYEEKSSVLEICKVLAGSHLGIEKIGMELMTVFCYIQQYEGFQRVLTALTTSTGSNNSTTILSQWLQNALRLAMRKKEIGRSGMIAGIGYHDDQKFTDKDFYEYFSIFLILLQTLLRQSIHWNERMQLRFKLYENGLNRIYEILSEFSTGNLDIKRQLEQLQLEESRDLSLLGEEYEKVKEVFWDIKQLINVLIRDSEMKPTYEVLVHILQLLMVCSRVGGIQYFYSVEQYLKQLLLNTKTTDTSVTEELETLREENKSLKAQLRQLIEQNAQLMVNQLPNGGEIFWTGDQCVIDMEEVVRSMGQSLNVCFDRLGRTVGQVTDGNGSVGLVTEGVSGNSVGLGSGHSVGLGSGHSEGLGNRQSVDIGAAHSIGSRLSAAISHGLITSTGLAATVALKPSESATTHSQTEIEELKKLCRQLEQEKLQLENKLKSPGEINGTTGSKEVTTTDITEPELAALAPPPPPPPPPAAVERRMKKSAHHSKHKLKPLFWEKLSYEDLQNSLWVKNMTLEREISSLLARDNIWSGLEQEFSIPKPVAKSANKKSNSPTKKDDLSGTGKEQTISVIHPKKAYNLTILLTRLKKSPKQVIMALTQRNKHILTPALLQQLLNYLPTPDEIVALQPYLSETNQYLATADLFLIEGLKLNLFEYRLRALLFESLFEEKIKDLDQGSLSILNSCHHLYKNEILSEFLVMILILGNVMNGSTFRGGAFGFRVSGLNALLDTKSKSGQSFLFWFLEVVEVVRPRILKLGSVFEKVKEGSRVSLTGLEQELNGLLEQVSYFKQNFSTTTEDDFIIYWKGYLKHVDDRMELVSEKVRDARTKFTQLIEWFGEDPEETKTDTFFHNFVTFGYSFNRTLKELESNHQQKEKQSLQTEQNPILDLEEENQKGVMDSLLESLRKGNVPQIQKERRRVSIDKAGMEAKYLLSQLNSF